MYTLRYQFFPNNEHRLVTFRNPPPRDLFAPEKEESSPLDIITELETQPPNADSSVPKSGFGKLGRATKFTLNARRTLLRVGGAMDRTVPREEVMFITLTLPGSTQAAITALAEWSAYAVHRWKSWVAKRTPAKLDFYVWELQKRGALHLHYVVHVPLASARARIELHARREWYRILRTIGNRAECDMFARAKGGTWSEKIEVLQVKVEVVRKSVAAYLSKYLCKSSAGKGFALGFTPPSPSRWYGASRPLLALLRSLTRTVEIAGLSFRDAFNIFDDIQKCLTAVSDRCYTHIHKLTGTKTVVSYSSTSMESICQMSSYQNRLHTDSSNQSMRTANWMRSRLMGCMKATGLTYQLLYVYCGAYARAEAESFISSKLDTVHAALAVASSFSYTLTFLYHPQHAKYQIAIKYAKLFEEAAKRMRQRLAESPELKEKNLSDWD